MDVLISQNHLKKLLRLIPRASQDLEEGISKGEVELELEIVESGKFYKTGRGKTPRIMYKEGDINNE